MVLLDMDNLGDSDPQLLRSEAIQDFDVFGKYGERIGKVVAIDRTAIDQSTHVVIKIGSWLSSRQVLVPLHHFQVDLNQHRVDLKEWTKESVEQLQTCSPIRTQSLDAPLESVLPLESSVSLEQPVVRSVASYIPSAQLVVNDMQQGVITQDVNKKEAVHETPSPKISAEEVIPLLAERLVVDRHKRKVGEVVVRKVIETEVIEVVVRREKLIVEQVSPSYKELAVIDLGETSIERKVIHKD
jgi:stress response protein YsnF